jgi:hypothetical protein
MCLGASIDQSGGLHELNSSAFIPFAESVIPAIVTLMLETV